MDCIFCKIIKGEIPAEKIYEDEKTLAFLDISPNNPGHTLVVAKEHYENIEVISEDLLCDIMKTIKKIGKAIKDGLGYPGYNLILNNDPVAGQLVPHLHFHVIPRRPDDGFKHWQQSKYQPGEAEEAAKKLRSFI